MHLSPCLLSLSGASSDDLSTLWFSPINNSRVYTLTQFSVCSSSIFLSFQTHSQHFSLSSWNLSTLCVINARVMKHKLSPAENVPAFHKACFQWWRVSQVLDDLLASGSFWTCVGRVVSVPGGLRAIQSREIQLLDFWTRILFLIFIRIY